MVDHNPLASDSGQPPHEGRFRGGRGPGQRDGGGGFRIRLSDNEVRAARSVQEAFGLRSTVAVLGFSVRTMAQMLEDGQLDELAAQVRAQGGQRRSRGEGGSRRGEGGRGQRQGERRGGGGRAARPDPFARPQRPSQVPPAEEAGVASAAEEAAPTPEAASTPEDGVTAEDGRSVNGG